MLYTATDRLRCEACGRPMSAPPYRGRPPRFCGTSCRSAAYRRRQQHQRESLPRWPHARGTVRLSELLWWEAEREEQELARAVARGKRAHHAAQKRAWRQWRHALAVAERRGVLYGTPAASDPAAAVWRDIAEAVAECSRLRVRGARWKQELDRAEKRVAALTPSRDWS